MDKLLVGRYLIDKSLIGRLLMDKHLIAGSSWTGTSRPCTS
jgi:hypothetical protein